jgi:predicted PurR-regulated permease PerM
MTDTGGFARRCLIVLAIAVVALVLYKMTNLLLLIFAAVTIASIFSAARSGISRLTGLKGGLALTVAVLAVIGLLVGVFTMFGTQIAREMDTIRERFPAALASAQAQLQAWGVEADSLRRLIDQGVGDVGAILSRAGGYALSAGSGLADFLLVLVGAIFLAAQPDIYRRGIVLMTPKSHEALVAQAMDDTGHALAGWLRGQLLSMLAVSVLTFTGLWLLGVPAALGLALIAGLLDFIPFVGPIIAAVPAIILAFLAGPSTALWTLGLYLLVQQIQGNILQPLVQRYAVDVPPAVLLFAVAGAGVLFGFLGILLSAPLTVVAFVLAQRLYIQGALGKDIKVVTEASTL